MSNLCEPSRMTHMSIHWKLAPMYRAALVPEENIWLGILSSWELSEILIQWVYYVCPLPCPFVIFPFSETFYYVLNQVMHDALNLCLFWYHSLAQPFHP